jgi:hypothetical protein
MTPRKQHPAWAICAALFPAAAGRRDDKPDFTGDWKLNVGKSDFGQRPGPLRASMKVSHRDPALHITHPGYRPGRVHHANGLFDRGQRDHQQESQRPCDEKHGEVGRRDAAHQNPGHRRRRQFHDPLEVDPVG